MIVSLILAVLTRQTLYAASTFAVLAVVVLLSDLVGAASSPLLDHSVLELLGPERRGDYGKQRLYGAVGWGVTALVVGALAQAVGEGGDVVYLAAQAVMTVPAIVALWRVPAPTRAREETVSPWKVATLVVQRPSVAGFLLVVCLMGMLMGQINTFLFVYLAELGGQEALFGLCLALTCVSEVPMFFFAGAVIARVGTLGVLCIAMATYVVRFVYYVFLTEPWAVLPAELLHGVTYALSWAACTDYAAQIAPPGLGATMQGVLSGVHWGLGQGLGSLVGGLLYERYGGRTSFIISAVVAALMLVVFGSLWAANRCRERAGHGQHTRLTNELGEDDHEDHDATAGDAFEADGADRIAPGSPAGLTTTIELQPVAAGA